MKKFLVTLGFLVLLTPSALADYSWNLPEVNQDITIDESGEIHVVETIKADFTNDSHHGIYRHIPISYRDKFGNPFNLRFKLLSVTDENGNKQPIASQYKSGGEYFIKIGDKDILRNDLATYVITYNVNRAIGYFDDHDELYWNPYSEWDVPVLSSEVVVHLPQEVNVNELKSTCYTGYYGENRKDCIAQEVDEKTLQYSITRPSAPGEGFTIVAGWPKGIVSQASVFNKVWWFITDNWSLLIPVFVFLFLFWKWYTAGRDPKVRDTIIPRFKPPDNLSPTEVGTIIDEKIDLHDITSVIITYAVKGYIKIHEIKSKKLLFFDDTDYELKIVKDYLSDKDLKPHEEKILKAIFGTKSEIKISELKYKFYKHLGDIKKQIYKGLIKDGYFVHNPENTKATYMGIGVAIMWISLMGAGFIVSLLGLTAIFAIAASGLLFIAFSFIMPRKTIKGAKALVEIKGLEEYIRTAEKDRIKFQEDQNIFFEKLLPYAMVLGLGEKWAEAFKDIYKKPPDWFSGSDMDSFNTYYLVNRLNNFSTHAQTAFASSPRSSGGGSSAWGGGSGFSGGFSGGGFGGGGGGGW